MILVSTTTTLFVDDGYVVHAALMSCSLLRQKRMIVVVDGCFTYFTDITYHNISYSVSKHVELER